MDRYNFEEHISAYIDGELSQENKIKFEELMESEPNCKKKYNQVSELVISLNSLPKLETDGDFIDKLNQQIDNHQKLKVPIFSIIKEYLFIDSRRPTIGFAMSCAAILIIFYVSLNNWDNNSAMASTPSDSQDEIYYSDIDSTDTDQYEDDIQLTKGVDVDK